MNYVAYWVAEAAAAVKQSALTNRLVACMHAVMQDERVAEATPHATPLEKEPLQVRIPVSIKRRFKAHAALRGIEPNELFAEIWAHYERTKLGATTPKDA